MGRRICEEFSFFDVRGRPQLAGCMKALGALVQMVPGIALPPPPLLRAPAIRNRPRQLEADVPEPEQVPAHPARIRDLEVIVVTNAADRALWNTLIAREHPHGMTTFAGRRVRYLVGSAHGWLGAAGFSAAALRVAARERWIGWDDEGRRAHLDRVVCLSRPIPRNVRTNSPWTWQVPATSVGHRSVDLCYASHRTEGRSGVALVFVFAVPTRRNHYEYALHQVRETMHSQNSAVVVLVLNGTAGNMSERRHPARMCRRSQPGRSSTTEDREGASRFLPRPGKHLAA